MPAAMASGPALIEAIRDGVIAQEASAENSVLNRKKVQGQPSNRTHVIENRVGAQSRIRPSPNAREREGTVGLHG